MDPLQFEQVAAHLLNATHNVSLPCLYGDKLISRQFDGYRVIWFGEFSRYKIGIECRKRSRKVSINSVEGFAKKIENCNVDKGIMVSFLGFTSNAMASAKLNSIDLFSLHPCRPEDAASGTKQIDFLELVDHVTRANFSIDADSISYEDVQTIDASLSIKQKVYDVNGECLGTLEDIGKSMIEFEVLTGGKKYGILEKDLSESSAHLEIEHRGNIQKIELSGLTIRYQIRYETKTDVFNPSNHYIMKNELTKEKKLIPLSKVNKILGKYIQSRI